MQDCGKCLHEEVCAAAKACDGHVPGCQHFMDKTVISQTLGKPKTRADQLRAMTDEQLARFLLEADEGNLTVNVCDEKYCAPERCPNDCTNAIIKWLQQPVEDTP